MFNLNLFQSAALEAMRRAQNNNIKSFLIVMPTGTGKTYLAAKWFKSQLENTPEAKLLYVCHNQDILTQANNKEFENCLSKLNISTGYYNGFEKNIQQCTFATIQTLTKHLDEMPPDLFDFVIVDEAHHYRAKSFETAIKHFTPAILMGLTATPKRMDNQLISKVFGDTIYDATIRDAIERNMLCKFNYYCVDNDIDFSNIKWNGNKYDETDLNIKMCIPEYDTAILNEYKTNIRLKHNKTKTIAFCATVEHAHRMSGVFNAAGINAVALTGKYNSDDHRITIHKNQRMKIIEDFKTGKYDIIFVRDLFNEGVDVPDADSIMMLRPTQSHTIFSQQIGRGLRLSENKPYLLILDFTGNCHRCNITFDALNEMIGIDIIHTVQTGGGGDTNTECVIKNLGCEVRLSKTKIDIINDVVTKEKLIENYRAVKAKLSRHIFKTDMDTCDISKYSGGTYHNWFGSWNKFLLEMGENVSMNMNISKEQLIDNYRAVKAKLSRSICRRDMDTCDISKYSSGTYLIHFGSWNKFLLEIGENINKHRNMVFSKEQLIDNYRAVKAKLSRPVHVIDMNNCDISKYSGGLYYRWFGSWNKFLLEIGEPGEAPRSKAAGASHVSGD